MVDLSTICGDAVLHASITKKRVKAQQKLDCLIAKNLSYAEKRRKIGLEATEKLGVTCWG